MLSVILRKGGELPPEIRRGFEVWPIAEPYWAAFWRLSRKRTSGFGPNPISYTEIVRFADRNGFDADELETIIDAMDAVYLRSAATSDEDD